MIKPGSVRARPTPGRVGATRGSPRAPTRTITVASAAGARCISLSDRSVASAEEFSDDFLVDLDEFGAAVPEESTLWRKEEKTVSKRSRAKQASRRELVRERLRACPSGKAAFPTRLAALVFASRVNVRGCSPKGVSLARAYRCPACRKWHLTSKRSGRNDGLPPGTVV